MSMRKSNQAEKSRELRRRVVLPARMRFGASWSDACILNLSSRGLLIHTSRPAPTGSQIELRRGEHIIVARVVWRDGAKAGLRAEDRVPVEEIVTLGQSQAFQITAGRAPVERRKYPRPEDQHRLRGKAIEFASVVAIGASLAGGAAMLVEQAFARPLAMVEAALGAPDQPATLSR
jgi:PilZ domain-containing protein